MQLHHTSAVNHQSAFIDVGYVKSAEAADWATEEFDKGHCMLEHFLANGVVASINLLHSFYLRKTMMVNSSQDKSILYI